MEVKLENTPKIQLQLRSQVRVKDLDLDGIGW
jgi:hypothetical protein